MYTVPIIRIRYTFANARIALAPSMTLKPLDRPAALGDQVYRTLREYLGSHVIVPGERIQEASLALQLRVSRTPVREALARLESEGLIVAEGRSFVVPVLSDDDVRDIYELRELLEPAALAQVAAARPAPDALAPISAALHDAEAAENAGDAETFIEANARFHASWHALIANRRLLRAIDVCAGHVRYLRVLTLNVPASRKAALAGMRKIVTALRRHDAGRAAQVMREHLAVARHHLRLVLDDIAREADAAPRARA